MSKKQVISILSWNANGLRQKLDEFREFAKENLFDVMLINETHLKPSHKALIPNYSCFRTDRMNGPGGGTMIFVKRCIEHHSMPSAITTNLENTIVKIKLNDSTSLTVAAIYNPPHKNLLLEDFNKMPFGNGPCILAGDFNAKSKSWKCSAENQNGKRLLDIADEKNLIIKAPQEHTHFSHFNGTSDILDIAVMQNCNFPLAIYAKTALSSDHDPICIDIQAELCTSELSPIMNINWQRFTDVLSETLIETPTLTSRTDIDKAVDSLTRNINDALSVSSKQIERKTNHLALPQFILDKIKNKNHIRKVWKTYRTTDLKTQLNRAQNEIKKLITEHKQTRWDSFLEELSPQQKNFWKLIKKTKRPFTVIPPLQVEGNFALSDPEKAEAIADKLQMNFTINNPTEFQTTLHIKRARKTVAETIKQPTDLRVEDLVEIDELKRAICHLKNNKTPGPDRIKNEAIKNFPRNVLEILIIIYNACLNQCYFPKIWKVSTIMPILKPGKDPALTNSYRPISLLSGIGKLLEKILHNRILKHCTENNIIQPNQFGFMKHLSTELQLMRLKKDILDGMLSKDFVGAVFLDVEKAFDRIWHTGLLLKLKRKNFPIYIIKLLFSYLKNRSFKVKVGRFLSQSKIIRAGVPQGSILGPLLFNIYLYEMPKPHPANIYLFADDTAALVRAKTTREMGWMLNDLLEKINRWLTTWLIKVNAEKSQVICFHRRRKPVTYPRILLNFTIIPWTNEVKYLGVLLDRRLTFIPHLKEALSKAKRATHSIYHLIGHKSKLSLKNKLMIYNTCIRPIITYASPVWSDCSYSQINQIQIFQNKLLRRFTEAPWFVPNAVLHRDLKTQTITEFITDMTEMNIFRTLLHENPLVRATREESAWI